MIFNHIGGGISRYLAGGGNILFFLLSAILYGMKWSKNEQTFAAKEFLKKRIVRIGVVLWPFLICLYAAFLLFNVDVPLNTVMANFLFLGAFMKLPGNGHLWFLSVIMMCYVEYVVLSRIRTGRFFLLLLSIIYVLFFIVLEYNSLPGNFVLILMMTAWMFLKTNEFNKWLARINQRKLVLVVLLMNITAIWLFDHDLFDTNRMLAYPLMDICGASWFCVLLKVLPSICCSSISFISSISFESYLIHHTLCAGPITKVAEWSDYKVVQFTLLTVVTFLLAYLLHIVSNLILKWKYLK